MPARSARTEIAVAAGLCLLAALWLWLITAVWPATPDGDIHLQRTRALAEAFGQGVFYPRWFPDFAFGYGHPVLHYYAPGSYVPAAALTWLGVDVLTATRLALAVGFGLSGAAAYGALRIVIPRAAALVGAVAYLVFPYRHYDLVVRGALPEFAAFLWLPLILAAALWTVHRPDRWRRAMVLAALSWAGLALTHNLTTLMAAPVFILGALLVAWRMRAPRTLLKLGAGPLLGALLSAFYTIPALLDASWVGIGASPTAYGYVNHLATWQDLWQWTFPYTYPNAAAPTVPLPGGLLPLAVAGLIVAWRAPSRRFALVLTLAALLLSVWLSSSAAQFVWEGVAPVLGKLQFPWRWQTITALAAAVLVALTLTALPTRAGWPVALGLSVAALLYAWPPAAVEVAPPTITRASLWAFDAQHGQIGATWTGEFLPRWVTAPRWTIGRAPETSPPAPAPLPIEAVPLRLGYLDATYRVTTPALSVLTLDRFYFPAWAATVDGTTVATSPQGELGLLGIALPAGIHTLRVVWAATPALWLGRALTALGWFGVLLLLRRGLRTWLAAWLLLGALALLGISGWTVRSHALHPVAADYGAVALRGAVLPPARDAATVTLVWTVAEQPPAWTVFVHVLGDNGRVVAQWDEPIGGPYRPPQRLQPGLLIHQPIHVPLDIAPGHYAVVAGLYAPDTPAAPLIPAGHDQAALPLGTLEVRP